MSEDIGRNNVDVGTPVDSNDIDTLYGERHRMTAALPTGDTGDDPAWISPVDR